MSGRRTIPDMRRLTLLSALLGTTLAAGALTTGAALADSSPEVMDVTPTVTVLNAADRHDEFFKVTFAAEAGENRFVATELVVADAKGTQPNEMFLGVTLSCTDPTGKTVASSEAGRNVWPNVDDFMIPVSLVLETDSAGTYSCAADVMICVPGDCNAPSGKGRVNVVSKKMNPTQYSFLYVSMDLPDWTRAVRIPNTKYTLIQPGKSATFTVPFDMAEATGSIDLGSILSITNCIEKDYPSACAKATKPRIQGNASLTLSMVATQVPTEAGVTCATAKATTAGGAGAYTLTWQQHHGVYAIDIPDFAFASGPGCAGTAINLAVTVKVGKGNAVVVEAGTKSKASSIAYVIPSSTIGLLKADA